VTGPGLRLLAVTLLRLACLLAVVTLALAVGFAAGWGAYITLATSSHHRWMPPPVPGDLALYEPESAGRPASYLPLPIISGPDRAPDAAGSTPVRPAAGQALRGYATYYATGPDCLCAAAGPALRAAIGTDWRGTVVEVRVPMANGRLIEVKLVDWCLCGPRHGLPTLLDLSDETVTALGLDPRRGVYAVEGTP